MTLGEANSAAHLVGMKPCCGDTRYQQAIYAEGGSPPYTYVITWLFKKRVIAMLVYNSQRFVTTAGIISEESDHMTGSTDSR
jgi:hypothetical protein